MKYIYIYISVKPKRAWEKRKDARHDERTRFIKNCCGVSSRIWFIGEMLLGHDQSQLQIFFLEDLGKGFHQERETKRNQTKEAWYIAKVTWGRGGRVHTRVSLSEGRGGQQAESVASKPSSKSSKTSSNLKVKKEIRDKREGGMEWEKKETKERKAGAMLVEDNLCEVRIKDKQLDISLSIQCSHQL
eukprot:gene9605-6753_t